MKIPGFSKTLSFLLLPVLVFGQVSCARLTPSIPIDKVDASLDKLIKDGDLKLARRTERVAVPAYRVVFVVQNSASARAGGALDSVGPGFNTGSKSSITMVLENVTPQQMQDIADQAYFDFANKLRESGIEMVPYEELRQAKSYQELDLTPASPEEPYSKSPWGDARHFIVMGPRPLPLWFGHFDAPIGDKNPFNQGNSKKMFTLSKELNAVVVIPQISIDFASLKSSGSSMLTSSSWVEGKPLMRITSEITGLKLFHSKSKFSGDGNIAPMKRDLVIPGEFGRIETISKSSNALLVGSFALAGLNAGPVSSKSKKALVADPSAYQAMALQGAEGVNKAFVNALKQAKEKK